MATADKFFVVKRLVPPALVIGLMFATTVFAQPLTNFQSFEEFKHGGREIIVAVTAAVLPDPVEPGGRFTLYVRVQLPAEWHIYSLEGRRDTLPTRIELETTRFARQGEWEESPPTMAMDGVLQSLVKTHEKTAEFSLRMQAPRDLAPGVFPIAGTLIYRLCDNKVCYLPREALFQTAVRVVAARVQ
ncbi:MAG: protein-disulfide reductase DsbD domain-containing protein [Nitrospinales bacterium]